MAVLEKKMTWQEFRQLELTEDDNFIYELINGILMKRTSPSLIHQDVSRKLERVLDAYLSKNPIGKYYHAPVDVYLDDDNGVVPDIVYISKERNFLVENDDFIAGAPDLIIEIISPGNIKRDRVEKMRLYEKFAVREFWLVDPNNRAIEVYVMKDNAYSLHAFLEMEGMLTSTVLTGLEMEVREVFE
jgi:Uma2 family endonuclease